ncbi:MAG: hypothetical protein QMD04_09540 [Anaerolineales bacterium]|nr:hypothetical protein [Anaerolineales bacterium]
MNRRNRTQLALGLILILVAAWLVVAKFRPDLTAWLTLTFDWPMWVVFAGGILLLIGLLVGAPGMAVPACIAAGIGGILYYQNASGDWASWAYMWALIPGFVGLGIILAGILGEGFRRNLREGLKLIVISAVMFLIFGAAFGGLDILGPYKEYTLAGLLFLLGLWLILRGAFRRRKE